METIISAVDLANDKDIDAALLALERIVDKGSDGYVTIAKMKKASLLIETGNTEEGLSIYLDLEKNAVDQSFRDIATILYVLNSMDVIKSEVLLKKVKPLENSKSLAIVGIRVKSIYFTEGWSKKISKRSVPIYTKS